MTERSEDARDRDRRAMWHWRRWGMTPAECRAAFQRSVATRFETVAAKTPEEAREAVAAYLRDPIREAPRSASYFRAMAHGWLVRDPQRAAA